LRAEAASRVLHAPSIAAQMSDLGQKRKLRSFTAMSALPLKVDIGFRIYEFLSDTAHVRAARCIARFYLLRIIESELALRARE